MKKGRVTIPTDENFIEGTKEIAALWGADAVRDCDGTKMPANAKELADKVYNTYFIVRGDNKWAKAHPEEAHRTFLITDRVTARSKRVEINLMEHFFDQQFEVDWKEVARWQVFDRTTGEEIKTWTTDESRGVVVIENAKEYHEYTVNFMVRVIWHPVQIYNYLTNNWTCEKQLMYDPAYPETAKYIKDHMRKWCEENPETNVVRFTTFLYQFTIINNEYGKGKYNDWFGYALASSPVMLDKFKEEYGYEITSEDIVDGGCYNNPFRVPNKKFLDYMDFVCRFVAKTVRELVDIVHSYGKEAMMFLGDDWIGAEMYGKYFKDMNLDAVVGSIGGGVTVRMLSEIPHVKYTEGRFYPYFFPDTFFDGNEDGAIAVLDWVWFSARRALLRKPFDRMGFGGYLSLAAKFPKFVKRAGQVCDEFRAVCEASINGKPYSGVTVGILNCWGKLRSWQSHMINHELWFQRIYQYQGILESLSGLAVDVKFLSFDDILEKGIDADIDVLMNIGDEGTAFVGGDVWADERIVTTIRKWIDGGHGFIGIGEPSAYQKGNRCFVLSDVLGVDIEKSLTLGETKYNIKGNFAHFITEDVREKIDYGVQGKFIYAFPNTEVVDIAYSDAIKRSADIGEVKLAVNHYGKGRAVYIAGLPHSAENARVLYRALYWAADKEAELKKAFSSNVDTDCSYYPESGKYAIINNTNETQTTIFYDIDGKAEELTMLPGAIIWK